jgi:RES domain
VPLDDPPVSLEGFPSLSVSGQLYRIHRSDHDPLYFSSTGESRFDLLAPRGTLYTAQTPVGAFLEVFRGRLIPSAEVAARSLTRLDRTGDLLSLADCTSPEARGFGITAAIHSTADYDLTQRWALAFADAGFDGIYYLVSHDPSAGEHGIALFAEVPTRSHLPIGGIGGIASTPVPDDLVAEVQRRFRLLVLPSR